MLEAHPMNFNNLKQNSDKCWNDQMQEAHSEGIYLKRPELRMPVLHQKLFVYMLEKLNYPPEFRR